MAIIDSNTNISYSSNTESIVKDGVNYYMGSITIIVTGDFGTASLQCSNHGYMGGQDKLVYVN
tara:strand:+ start:2387 stop:2575 length:189 start_codon:yes stop_codon:yes gene_type:complete